ncbi:MAG: hypothetical protein RIR48_3448 [Bacteroidota bacterium]|jgi:hypothetical protein
MKYYSSKNLWAYLPEIFLLLSIGFVLIMDWIKTSSVNYFMICFGVILLILIMSKNKYLAIGLAIILGSLSCYMLFALLSEYNEFPSGDSRGTILLTTGSLIFCSLLIISMLLPLKYFKRGKGLN